MPTIRVVKVFFFLLAVCLVTKQKSLFDVAARQRGDVTPQDVGTRQEKGHFKRRVRGKECPLTFSP